MPQVSLRLRDLGTALGPNPLFGGWPALLMMFVCAAYGEGAPSLRFLQGRVAMLPTRLFVLLHKPIAYAFVVPALCKLRKGRGTLGFVCASEFKGLGHPPSGLFDCRKTRKRDLLFSGS